MQPGEVLKNLDSPPHYPSMDSKDRDREIIRLKNQMSTWSAKDFRSEYKRIKNILQGGSNMGELEHSKQATKLMLNWQAMRELLEEQL
jgi:hypothetical protein